MTKRNTVSPLLTSPYKSKGADDYHDLPVSKARQRKIDHVRKLLKSDGWSKARVRDYALHGMNMYANDVVKAFEDVS